MPTLRVDVTGLRQADTALRRFVAALLDWRPYWRLLGERLATEAQQRWPLKRRSGKLRRSLTWAGGKLWRGGIFQSDPDRLRFGSSIFYGKFAQFGTKKQQATPLIHVDADDASKRLGEWVRARATAAGLEVFG